MPSEEEEKEEEQMCQGVCQGDRTGVAMKRLPPETPPFRGFPDIPSPILESARGKLCARQWSVTDIKIIK